MSISIVSLLNAFMNPVTTLYENLASMPIWLRIFVVGLAPALLTGAGALPVLLGRRIGDRGIDAGLGFSAGVMLVASFTSLLLPAMETGVYAAVYPGFVAGVLLVYVLNSLLPHLHIFKGYEGPRGGEERYRRLMLVALAVIIHNVPEGMAIGVSAIYSVVDGLVVALAIGIQDMPEGFAVAFPIYSATGDRGRALAMGFFSGVAELAAAYIPLAVIAVSENMVWYMLPFMMSLAAGAMVYVVVHELVPEIYGRGHDEASTLGFFIGFIAMLSLDTLLG